MPCLASGTFELTCRNAVVRVPACGWRHVDTARMHGEVLDRGLTPDDMGAISALARGDRRIDPDRAPAWDA